MKGNLEGKSQGKGKSGLRSISRLFKKEGMTRLMMLGRRNSRMVFQMSL